MTLQLKVTGLPAFGPPQVLLPRLARQGVRVSHVVLGPQGLVFRGERGAAPGIYLETGEEDRSLILDSPHAFHVAPVAAGAWVAVHRGRPGRIPALVEEIVFVDGPGGAITVQGQTVGVSGDGRIAVVANVPGRSLHVVDLTDRSVRQVATITAGMDPHLAPIISVDATGTRALFMDAREERCDGSLELIDLTTGKIERLLGPYPAPARLCGAFSPAGNIVALEMRAGDTPHFRLLRHPSHVALKLDIAQPLSAPAFVDESHVVLPLSLTTHPNATYGPVDVVMVSLVNGTTVPLTRTGDLRGRMRAEAGAVLLEGGDGVLRFPILAG